MKLCEGDVVVWHGDHFVVMFLDSEMKWGIGIVKKPTSKYFKGRTGFDYCVEVRPSIHKGIKHIYFHTRELTKIGRL